VGWLRNFWNKRHRLAKQLKWRVDLDYYIYRSTSKIDMLWEQIDARSLAKISGELKIKLGVIEATGKLEQRSRSIHDKLRIVLRYLELNEQVGDVGSGKPFVRGVMPMTWQEVDFYRGRSDASMVLFSGFADAGTPYASEHGATLVGLVGSAAYVTGMNDLKKETLVAYDPRVCIL
jgi:hypothetical protein